MDNGELLPHLFRTEFRKVVSVLCRRFGFARMEIAEDIAGDTFAAAAEAWGLNGVPPNPAAWLYTVAANKAKNLLQRDQVFERIVAPELRGAADVAGDPEIDLSPENIKDSQLQMMFAICHPSISAEAQIGLSLRILCGFGIEEIADAFLTSKETINKRLFRARETLREEGIAVELPAPLEIDRRLDTVLRTIYLLFSEGYYSSGGNAVLRKDLCLEAIRLCHMLTEYERTNTPEVNALLSLMCFHASRFEARLTDDGDLVLYQDQDAGLWNAELIGRGGYYLKCASRGEEVSRYHLEAAIAYWHTVRIDSREKWENILRLYGRLLELEYSPIAALNRIYALAKVRGKNAAINEAEKLNLADNRFFFTLLGELYKGVDDGKAEISLRRALALAKTPADKKAIQKNIDRLKT